MEGEDTGGFGAGIPRFPGYGREVEAIHFQLLRPQDYQCVYRIKEQRHKELAAAGQEDFIPGLASAAGSCERRTKVAASEVGHKIAPHQKGDEGSGQGATDFQQMGSEFLCRAHKQCPKGHK